MQQDILVSMYIGFGLFDMFVVEADVQLQFYRMVTEFVLFLRRTAISRCFHVALRCLVFTIDWTSLFREETRW